MPSVSSSATLKAEFHCHTDHSRDSAMSLEALVAACRRRGINCLAVTDHNRIAGALAMRERAPFRVIVGEEVRTQQGEIVGLFLEELVPPDLSPEETIRRIRAQGGIVYLPHPFDRVRRSSLTPLAIEALADEIDVVEVLNARTTFAADREQAWEFCRRHGLIPAAGSDAHSPLEVGRAYVEMPLFHGKEDFLDALRQGRLGGSPSPYWVHFLSMWARWRNRHRHR